MTGRMLVLLTLFAAWFPRNARGQQYFVRHFTNEQGLPANTLKGLAWEPETRLLWIGTEAGVCRWDGHRFAVTGLNEGRVYQMGGLSGSDSTRFYVLAEAYRSYVIAGGRMRASGRKVHVEATPAPLSLSDSSAALRILNDFRKELLLPSFMQALDTNRKRILVNYLGSVYLSTPGAFVKVGSGLGTVFFFRMQHRVLLLGERTAWEFLDSSNSLRPVTITGLPRGIVHFITDTDTPNPFASVDGRLYQLSLLGNGLSAFSTDLQLPADATPTIIRHMGAAGPIAIGDRYNGLYLLTLTSLRQPGDPHGGAGKDLLVTYGQTLLSNGRILNSNGVEFTRAGPIAVRQRPFPGTVNLFRYHDFLYGSTPANGHLLRYNPQTGATSALGGLDGTPWITFCTAEDTLFVWGRRTLYRMEGERLYQVQTFDRDITRPTQLGAVALPGGLQVACEGTGLRFIDPPNRRTWFRRISQNAPVRYLYVDGEDLFICTYGEGIFLLRNGVVRALPTDKMGYLLFAHTIVPDGRGFCFIASNNGLFRVAAASLRAAGRASDPIYYHFLGRSDGLSGTEFNGGCLPAYVRWKDGSLSFPSIQGPVIFHPDSLYTPPPEGRMLLMNIDADGKALSRANPELPADVRLVTIDMVLPFWGAAENQYSWYRLIGTGVSADTAWVALEPGAATFRFASLRPGGYRLEIRTFSGVFPGEMKVLAIPFRVMHHWYFRPWAIGVWLAALLALVAGILRWRTARIQRRTRLLESLVVQRTVEIQEKNDLLEEQLNIVSETNRLKDRLISVISHNIITPLRYIHQATTMMRENARTLDPELREKAVDSINDTSLELELLSVNLLNWIKVQHQQVTVLPETFSPADVIYNVKSLLKPIAASRGIEVKAGTICSEDTYQFKDALQVIVYNLVLNALQHSGGSRIEVSCNYCGGIYSLSVNDNGKGIPPLMQQRMTQDDPQDRSFRETDNVGKGLGIVLIKDFVRMMKGRITVRSSSPRGSIVFVEFYSLRPGEY